MIHRTFVILLGLSSLAACGGERSHLPTAQAAPPAVLAPAPANPPAARSGESEIERGGQLVALGGCGDCHTPKALDPALGMPVPQLKLMLSGHPKDGPEPVGQPGTGDQGVIGGSFTSFRLPFGVVYAANLTPDVATGLGGWTKEEFIRTMRTGHRKGDGRPVLPPMPWQNMAASSDADLSAMFAYLKSIPAIANAVPEPKVPAPVLDALAKSYAAAAKM